MGSVVNVKDKCGREVVRARRAEAAACGKECWVSEVGVFWEEGLPE